MSLIDLSFLPYLLTKSLLKPPPSHNALVLPKDKSPSLVLPPLVKTHILDEKVVIFGDNCALVSLIALQNNESHFETMNHTSNQ